MTTEEIVNMAKLYAPRIDDETIECFGKLEKHIGNNEQVKFAFTSAFFTENSTSFAKNVAIVVTDCAIYICGKQNGLLKHLVRKITSAFSLDVCNMNGGWNVIINKHIRLSMAHEQQARLVSQKFEEVLGVQCKDKIVKEKKNTVYDFFWLGRTLITLGSILTVLAVLASLAMLFSYGLLVAFIVFVSGALSGLLVCGIGAIVVNTSELVKMGKEK
ncbi:MAG: hypothetical protein J6L69_08045 [Lachnospiraceae bacterium]|nr:hypothetical protein [Lachnospiraceae bacterium]